MAVLNVRGQDIYKGMRTDQSGIPEGGRTFSDGLSRILDEPDAPVSSSRSPVKLFGGVTGAVSVRNAGKGTAYITFSLKGGDMTGLLNAKAPVTGIRIHQGVDRSLQKALSGDYLISVFGHSPVSIFITGLQFTGQSCGVVSSSVGGVQSFYDTWNVWDRPDARINVGISGASESGAFTCIMTSLSTRLNEGKDMPANSVGYVMELLGVKL